jgi:rsbT co-antagonist protein RsbR
VESDAEPIVLSRPRFSAFSQVLRALLAGKYTETELNLEVTELDDFAELETMFAMFAREYAQALLDNERLAAERLQTIERQRAAISDLATPIIDIWDDILTLPIVGVVDTQRSVEMTEKLLHRITTTRARCVIVDVTGVDVVDTSTADHLVKMMKAAQMLGSTCVVTGISPSIAQTLVQLDVDLSAVRTLRSLKDGLKECFRTLRAERDEP